MSTFAAPRRIRIANRPPGCVGPDCTNRQIKAGLCSAHYKQRVRGYLTPIKKRPTGSDEERFWAYVDKSGDCWKWQGCFTAAGYGMISIGGKQQYAHRVSLAMHTGVHCLDLEALHSCDNPPCVRPDHLRWGTNAENRQDAVLRGRIARGESAGTVALTESKVREIRAMASLLSHTEIARRFQTTSSNVSRIASRKTWRHVQ